MKVYDFKTIENVFMIGDIHGEFDKLILKIKSQLNMGQNYVDTSNELDKKINFRRIIPISPFTRKIFQNSLIFVAGDCGFGFNKEAYYKSKLLKLNNMLSQANNFIIFVRGNHDDPNYFNNDILGFSNILCVPDYSVIKTQKYTTLCVGGGLSIDKEWRLKRESQINRFRKKGEYMKKLYWEDEMPFFSLKELNAIKKEGIVIDSIVTHTAPSFVAPKEKSINIPWIKDNKNLANEAKKEREIMDNIFNYFFENNIKIKFWIYGHFHINSFKKYNNILFFALSDNYAIFDTDKELEKYQNFVNSYRQINDKEKISIKTPTDSMVDINEILNFMPL